jgi:ABC-type multidrug transport system ATPase subunit
VLILDEPSASLDLSFKNSLRSFIKEFTEENGTVIMSSHDPDDFRSADHLFLLKDRSLSPTDYDTLMKEFSS